MKAQHFARNILAAAVLSALGAHAAVAADFSEGVYENHGEQDVYDNFIVKNTDGAELDNSAGVLIQKMGVNVGSLTVNKQFRVDVSATETHASLLAGVRLAPKSLLKLLTQTPQQGRCLPLLLAFLATARLLKAKTLPLGWSLMSPQSQVAFSLLWGICPPRP